MKPPTACPRLRFRSLSHPFPRKLSVNSIMKNHFVPRLRIAALSAAAAIAPLHAQTPVPAGTESAHFKAAAQHLEIGGGFFGYMDIDGDFAGIAPIADRLLALARQQPGGENIPEGIKTGKLLEASGLGSLKALGFSSRTLGKNLFHNRAILLTPGGPQGIFRLFGKAPAPLEVAAFAPKDSDVAYQGDFTLSALRGIIESALTAAGDENMLAQFRGLLDFPIPPLNMTAGEVLDSLNLRVMTAAKLDGDRKLTIPGSPSEIPAFNAMVSIDGLDFIMDSLLVFARETDAVTVEKGDGFNIVKPANPLPAGLDYFSPALYHDVKSKKIIFTTHVDYARAALAGTERLRDSADFQKATAGLPAEANGMTYASERFLKSMTALSKQIMEDAPKVEGAPASQLAEELSRLASELTVVPDQGIAGTYSLIPEGMLFLSNTSENHKHTIAQTAAVPLALIAGIAGAQANIGQAMERARGGQPEMEEEEIPSDDPATPQKTVRSNLQQIAFAAQTWFIDNPDAKEVTYEQLISAELLFDISPANGESYKGLTLQRAGGRLSVSLKDGDSVGYSYPAVTD